MNRRRMTAHHPAPSQSSSGSLPAIPAGSLGSKNEETDEPDSEHDQRDPPQHVNRKSEPAEYEREQQHQQNGTHGLSPPCRRRCSPNFGAFTFSEQPITSPVCQQSSSKFANRSRRSSCHVRMRSTPSLPNLRANSLPLQEPSPPIPTFVPSFSLPQGTARSVSGPI